MEDALLVGGMLITLLNHADRVKIACMAQSVNVIAPIMTAKDGGAWRQTIFFPFAQASRYGRGKVLRQMVNSPAYDIDFRPHASANLEQIKNVQYLLSSVIYREDDHEITIFAVNRNLAEALDLTVNLDGFVPLQVIEWQSMSHTDLKAVNAAGNEKVQPRVINGATLTDNQLSAALPPASWNMLRIKI